MDKLKMKSVDGVDMNIEKIKYAVDYDLLKQELSDDLIEGDNECY